jgi:hypothetical protein
LRAGPTSGGTISVTIGEELGAMAFVQLASIRPWLRVGESTPQFAFQPAGHLIGFQRIGSVAIETLELASSLAAGRQR